MNFDILQSIAYEISVILYQSHDDPITWFNEAYKRLGLGQHRATLAAASGGHRWEPTVGSLLISRSHLWPPLATAAACEFVSGP